MKTNEVACTLLRCLQPDFTGKYEMKIRYVLATIAALSFSAFSHAEFVATNVYAENDQKATLDSETGLEWLDLTETFDKSYDNVINELSTTYAGFRLPTVEEVTFMLDRYLSQNFQTTFTGTLGGQKTIASGVTNGSGAGILNNFNRVKSNFGGSLCSVSGSSCSTYSSQAENTRGQVLGMVHNSDYVADGTKEYSSYGLRISRLQYSFNNNTNATVQYGQTDVDTDRAYHGSGTKLGTWLVSDGGTTLSSIQDPSLNSNNANAPVNEVPAGGLSLLTLAAFGLLLRRKAK
jgi:hypothetical protein